MKLFLKGDRCYTDKCAFERRSYPPGQHGQAQRREKYSDYKIQLREKQKVKRIYGILEKQFKIYYERAERMKGITGTNLLVLLERRLDNVIYRLGFASSRRQARQWIRHGHFLVNGEKVDIPSYQLDLGDVIEIRDKSKNIPQILEALQTIERRGVPEWLELDKHNLRGVMKALPSREFIDIAIQEQLIVEFYSK